MIPNFYHVTLNTNDNSMIEVPSTKNSKIEQLFGNSVTRITFDSGDEMLRVSTKDKLDIYASFPIVVKKN